MSLPHFMQSAAALAMFRAAAAPSQKVLDSIDEDSVAAAAQAYAMQSVAMQAAAAAQEWAETTPEDLEEGEGLADRLWALLVGIADENQDGELDEAEQAVVETAGTAVWEYLSGKGVSDDDIDAIMNGEPDAANAAADRVVQMLAAKLPDDDEAADDMDDFAFSDQGAVFDAVYKKKMAIRDGKKVRVMKRISGRVVLTSKQKVAIKKAALKSRSAAAVHKRMKSMRKRKAMGLKA